MVMDVLFGFVWEDRQIEVKGVAALAAWKSLQSAWQPIRSVRAEGELT